MWIWHGFAGFVGGLQKHMDLLEGQADHLVREDLHGFAIFHQLAARRTLLQSIAFTLMLPLFGYYSISLLHGPSLTSGILGHVYSLVSTVMSCF